MATETRTEREWRTDFFFADEQELLEKAEKNSNITLGVLATIPVLLFTMLFSLCFGKKKSVSSVSGLSQETLLG